jgi:hypothetical protein
VVELRLTVEILLEVSCGRVKDNSRIVTVKTSLREHVCELVQKAVADDAPVTGSAYKTCLWILYCT